MNKQSLLFQIQLLLPFVLTPFVITAVLILFLFVSGSQVLEQQLRTRVLNEFNFLQHEFQEDGITELIEEIEERLEKNRFSWRFLYSIRSNQGEMLFDTLPQKPDIGWSTISNSSYAPSTLLYTEVLNGGYHLSVGLAKNELQTYQVTFLKNAGWMLLIGVIASVAFCIWAYRRFTMIVKNISIPVQQFKKGNHETRIPQLYGGPELNQLAGNINDMFNRIEGLMEQYQSLSINVAHDIRTPLTRIKNRLSEIANKHDKHEGGSNLNKELKNIERDIDESLRFLHDILKLNEIKYGQLQEYFTTVDLSALLQECIELYEPLFCEANIEIRSEINNAIHIKGSETLLKQAFINIIENTLAHTQGNCVFNIDLKPDKRHAYLLKLSDNGIVRTTKKGPTHYGFGLKLVDAITELHHGEFHWEKVDECGFECTFVFPAQDQ